MKGVFSIYTATEKLIIFFNEVDFAFFIANSVYWMALKYIAHLSMLLAVHTRCVINEIAVE